MLWVANAPSAFFQPKQKITHELILILISLCSNDRFAYDNYILISLYSSNDLPHSLYSFIRTTIIVVKYITTLIFEYFCRAAKPVFLLYKKRRSPAFNSVLSSSLITHSSYLNFGRPVAQRQLNTHFVLLPQMRLVAFHLEQKQKSFSRFLFIFVGTKCRILVSKKSPIYSAASSKLAAPLPLLPIAHRQYPRSPQAVFSVLSPFPLGRGRGVG